MKIIALGDTHGRPYWAHIADHVAFDKLVFIGDYFDSNEGITPEMQQANFEEIIVYKQQNLDKVVLLLGNHDYHYLKTASETYSGYQAAYATVFGQLLQNAINQDLMQMCFVVGKYLFSHAGVTQAWAKANNISFSNIQCSINELFKKQPNAFRFAIGENYSETGDDVHQSPIWVRPNSLGKDSLKGFIQIVGHTPQPELLLTSNAIFIDTLGTTQQYLIINNGIYSVENIPIFTTKKLK